MARSNMRAVTSFPAARAVRLLAVMDSLRTAFGDGALLVARGQPPGNDIGRESGICWKDVIDGLVDQQVPARPGRPHFD